MTDLSIHRMIKYTSDMKKLEREGRLLILPCKKGDTFWEIQNGVAYPRIAHTLQHCVYVLERLGKTTFLTQEEANSKIKGVKEMERVAKFYKVSFEQFLKDWMDTFYPDRNEESLDDLHGITLKEVIRDIYEDILLPKRATKGSAGYDFHIPSDITIPANGCVKIPTGIRCEMKEGWVLKAYPRSGHGFKTGVHLANTVGIIDEDYFHSDNEGHIQIKLVNDSLLSKDLKLKEGDAFCQGIFIPFGITIDDNATAKRNGGFGSTTK